MALKICPLGSGSKGNAVYISNDKHSFLIDCGLSIADIKRGLDSIDACLNDINGILVTHEHIDHIRSAGMLAEGYGIPIYAHEQTFKALNKKFPKIKNAATYKTFSGFSLCGLHIIPFLNPHDVFTVGYSIADDNSRIVYATDLGYVPPSLFDLAQKADLVMLESNYDTGMLYSGRYPYHLKRRIASERGHLSNDDSAEAIGKMLERGTNKFILGHLSEENNFPALALAASCAQLDKLGAVKGEDYYIGVALQKEAGQKINTSLTPQAITAYACATQTTIEDLADNADALKNCAAAAYKGE